ncbi:hypothetical protein [Neolewinella persica]|uniref:hypothetical protein n=1 Tax=Neolewinella persica TaxID=70998 RepID=UPI0005C52531|nr:hypothetical protein [Neolewinella persica]
MYEPNTIYHFFNHTNNKELLFRGEEDYNRFVSKIRKHLLPYADILCYCLMPTHFHFQLVINESGLGLLENASNQQKIHGAFRIMLSSYVRYFNARYDRRGSLLRAKTKGKPAYMDFIPESWELEDDIPFTRYIPYILTCFRYIHLNPVEARLVLSAQDWPFSSAPDFAGLRDEGLCNYDLVSRLIGIERL